MLIRPKACLMTESIYTKVKTYTYVEMYIHNLEIWLNRHKVLLGKSPGLVANFKVYLLPSSLIMYVSLLNMVLT